MDGVEYDNWDVFQEQRKQEPGWQWPLNFAVVLHVAVFAGSFVLPDYFERKPHFDNIVTVSLISMPEPAPAAPVQLKASAVEPEITAVREKEAAPEPRPQKEAAGAKTFEPKKMVAPELEIIPEPPVASAPEAVPEPTVVQVAPPISLNPVKRKITVAKDTRLAEERALEAEKKKKVAEAEKAEEKRIAKKKEQNKQAEKKRIAEKKEQDKQAEKSRLAEAERRKKEKKAVEAKKAEKKRIAEKERARVLQREKVAQARQRKALAEAKQMERQAEQAQREAAKARHQLAVLRGDAEAVDSTLSGNNRTVAGGTGGGLASPVVISQYTASLNGRISTHWKLPAMVTVNRKLKTMVALTVRRDGSIEDMRIERKSGDPFFDQSVMKALRNAEPLPDFPALITEPALEFALNFTPQGLAL